MYFPATLLSDRQDGMKETNPPSNARRRTVTANGALESYVTVSMLMR